MHLFPALPQPLRWCLGLRAKGFNGALEKFVEDFDRCEIVTINYPFDNAYIAEDGFHPGALAYSIWASHIAGIIRSRLDRTVFIKDQI